MIPICYGLIARPRGSEIFRIAGKTIVKCGDEEFVLGGCVIWEGQPDYFCKDCGNSFLKDKREDVLG
ncbi:MAG: hypothetical protein QW520_06330 [Methanomassiliicoccales archaeon]